MLKPILSLTLVGILAPAALAADPDLDNKPVDQQRAVMRQEAENEAQQLKPIKADKLTDVLTFSIQGGDLALKSTLPPTEGYAHLKVNGLSGFSKVQINAGGVNSFQLIHQDFPPDGVVVLTMVFSMPNHLQVSRDEERNDERRNIQLIQSDQYANDGDGKVKLYINVSKKLTGEVVTDLKLSAANILEMRRKHPMEMAKYIEPIFRDLHQEYVLGEVDPKLAWQVFAPRYTPDPQLEKKVTELTKQLDAEMFGDRERATKELAKLGAPAALVLMRMNRAGMSEEQQTRIDALIAPFKPLSDEEANKLRTDKFFLMDCLYCDDAQIRTWAVNELKTVLKTPVAFDVNAPKDQRIEAVAALRNAVLNATTQPASPTTKPSVQQ